LWRTIGLGSPRRRFAVLELDASRECLLLVLGLNGGAVLGKGWLLFLLFLLLTASANNEADGGKIRRRGMILTELAYGFLSSSLASS
jgi:hypothetical protein